MSGFVIGLPRTLAAVAPLLLVTQGCSTSHSIGAPERPLVAEAVAEAPPDHLPTDHELIVARADAEGRPLNLRCLVYASDSPDPFAVHDGEGEARLRLEPGRYRLLVFAEPHPFGFDVRVTPERPQVAVQIFSERRAHTVVTEARRERVGEGVLMIERQILGFGWGEPPVPGDQLNQRIATAREVRLAELRRQAEEANAARRAEARRKAARAGDARGASALGEAESPQTDLTGGAPVTP